MSTPAQLLRDSIARHEALLRYAAAYDRFATEEQHLLVRDLDEQAAIAHGCALICLRAYRAEMDNPPQPDRER